MNREFELIRRPGRVIEQISGAQLLSFFQLVNQYDLQIR